MKIEDIVQGCKEGNRKCQDALVQKFAPGLLALCMRYTSDKELAKDALQECFINVFKYIHKYEGKGSFEGWIKRIAVTCTLTIHKKYHQIYFVVYVKYQKLNHLRLLMIFDQILQYLQLHNCCYFHLPLLYFLIL